MFHHAIEMLLKGYLINSHTSAELKEIGHKLSCLWAMYKSAMGDIQLARFDKTIADLDRVELLRYPDAMVTKGFVLNIRLGVPKPAQIPGSRGATQYFVNVSDLDDLALAIFSACNVNPKAGFKNTPAELVKALPKELRPYE